MALFDTAADVRQTEQQQRAALSQTNDPNGGAFFNLGHALGNAGIRGASGLTGDQVDTRSHAEIKAGLLQESLKGLDFRSRASVFKHANKLKDEGNFAEATQVLSMMPAADAQTWGKPVTTTEEIVIDGKKTKRSVTTITGSDGDVKKIDAFTGIPFNPESEGGGRADDALRPVISPKMTLSEPMKLLVDKSIIDIVNQRNGNYGLADESVDGVVGRVETLAARMMTKELKAAQSEAFQLASANGQFNGGAYNDIMSQYVSPSPQDFAQRAINLIKESGESENYTTMNEYFADEVSLDTGGDVTPQELEKEALLNQHAEQERVKDEEIRAKMKVGLTANGELNLKNVDIDTGIRAFKNFAEKMQKPNGPEMIAENFRALGVDVGSGEAYQTHVNNWQWMAASPEFTTAWIGAVSPADRKSIYFDYREKLSDEERMEEFYRIGRVNDYLGQMKKTDFVDSEGKGKGAGNPAGRGIWNFFFGE